MAIVIGIAGYSGVGKTTVARFLADEHGAWVVRPSDILRRILRGRGVTHPTRQQFSDLYEELVSKNGECALADLVIGEIRTDPEARLVVIDGIRRFADHTRYKDEFAGYHLIYVYASPLVRVARLNARGERPGDAGIDLKKLIEQDRIASEREIDDLFYISDISMLNDYPLSAVHNALDVHVSWLKRRAKNDGSATTL